MTVEILGKPIPAQQVLIRCSDDHPNCSYATLPSVRIEIEDVTYCYECTNQRTVGCRNKELLCFIARKFKKDKKSSCGSSISNRLLHDPVTWYRINYAGTQMTQWDFQSKRTLTSPDRLSFILRIPLRYLRPSIIYSVRCDRIVQRIFVII